MAETASKQPEIEVRRLERHWLGASPPEPERSPAIADLLAEKRAEGRLGTMNDDSPRLTPKHIAFGQDLSAPITVLSCGDRIPFVEGDAGKELGPASQVVRRGKDESSATRLTLQRWSSGNQIRCRGERIRPIAGYSPACDRIGTGFNGAD
jgi:hypothetical protein